MVFFLAFTTKAAYCAYQVVKEDRSVVDEVILLGLWVPWHVLPSSFVFFTHHMAYRNMVESEVDDLKQSLIQSHELILSTGRFAQSGDLR